MSATPERVQDLSPDDKRALLARMLSARRDAGRISSLSFGQQRLWFLDRFEPGSPFYNVATGARFAGLLDAPALERSLREIVRRHEILRSTFPMRNGEPVQVVAPEAEVALRRIDLGDDGSDELVAEAAARDVSEPFDLDRGPLLRPTLVRVADNDHVLMVTLHHIVADGWSLGVLMQELSTLYAAFVQGLASPLAEPALQYSDFAAWQRRWLSGERLERHLAYWRKQLAGVPAVLELPADRPRPQVQRFRGAMHSFMLPVGLADRLRALAREHDATLFMALLAAWATLLHRYTGEDDIVVGAPIANRTRAETHGLIGFFVNTLALRVDLSGNPTFRELLRRVRETTLGAYEHQDLPFEKLIEDLDPERDLSRNPLFQVMFVLQNVPTIEQAAPSPWAHTGTGTAKFDLTLAVAEGDWGLMATLEYSTDLFNPARIARMAGHLETLLVAIAEAAGAALSELNVLTTAERRHVVEQCNDTRVPYPEESLVHALFEAQADRTPNAIALACGEEQLTYAELEVQANRLAHALRDRGAGPDTPVAVLAERSVALVVALLGILKAGAVYMPLDPSYPPERLAYMLADAGAPLVLAQAGLAVPDTAAEMVRLETIEQARTTRPDAPATPDSGAYLLYTSGSTGRPKGVLVPHRPLVNHMLWMEARWPLAAGDAVIQRSPSSFDASLWEFLAPLTAGARLVLAPSGVGADTAALVREIRARDITTLQLVPPLLEMLVAEPELVECRSLRHVFVGGGPFAASVAERLLAQLDTELHSLYGVTEACIDSTSFTYRDEGDGVDTCVPIGAPIANVRAYVLDRYLQPVAAGVPGELCIGGAGLARGYLGRPVLTAKRFVPDPFADEPGARMYRTGDLARRRDDGTLEFLARLDDQVKLRGVRIELGEVETLLARHPGVRAAVCAVHDYAAGDSRLVAYVVPSGHEPPSPTGLRDFLAGMLPGPMLPSAYVTLDALPLSPNGKVDRQALRAPGGNRPAHDGQYVAPRSATEKAIADVWSGLLGTEPIGAHDNFFTLGGHSLLAMQAIAAANDSFGVELAVRRIFESPTVAGLAAAIVEALIERLEPEEADAVLEQLEREPHA